MSDIEFAILDFIQDNFRTDFSNFIMPLISALGNKGIIWIITGLILCISKKYRKSGIIILTALVFSALLCNLTLKPLVARMRPFTVNSEIKLLINAPTDFSFPSGHTASSFSVAFALLFNKNRLWIPSMILAVLIAFSRLYLYVHYPTDVLCGIIIGLITGISANIVCKILFKKYNRK
ncbi:MAG: phosphatase PAP2 family protein [Ruminococcus sp.]|nr:phosphatase PAP2 family protein [Ruminococcus sp.]